MSLVCNSLIMDLYVIHIIFSLCYFNLICRKKFQKNQQVFIIVLSRVDLEYLPSYIKLIFSLFFYYFCKIVLLNIIINQKNYLINKFFNITIKKIILSIFFDIFFLKVLPTTKCRANNSF